MGSCCETAAKPTYYYVPTSSEPNSDLVALTDAMPDRSDSWRRIVFSLLTRGTGRTSRRHSARYGGGLDDCERTSATIVSGTVPLNTGAACHGDVTPLDGLYNWRSVTLINSILNGVSIRKSRASLIRSLHQEYDIVSTSRCHVLGVQFGLERVFSLRRKARPVSARRAATMAQER